MYNLYNHVNLKVTKVVTLYKINVDLQLYSTVRGSSKYNFIHLKITIHFVARSEDLEPIFTSRLEWASKNVYHYM